MQKALWLLAAALLAWGCDPKGEKTVDPSPGSRTNVTDTHATRLPQHGLPSRPAPDITIEEPDAPLLDSEALRLARFWALDRFGIDGGFGPLLPTPRLAQRLLAKAKIDECFHGVGLPGSAPLLDLAGEPYCPAPDASLFEELSLPKRNGGYIWALGKTGDSLWLGTIANTHCLVVGGNLPVDLPTFENDHYVCEFADSASGTADWRRPQLLRYDRTLDQLVDLSPPPGSPAGELLAKTTGVRSVGISGDTVIFGGPAIVPGAPISSEGTVGINLFAFDALTGELLAAKRLDAYNNIRAWLEVDGVLYTAVAHSAVQPGLPAGSVLRWRGERVPVLDGPYPFDPDALFSFEVVGDLDAGGASLVKHQGRLFISTWPTIPAIDPQNPVPLPVLLASVRVAGLYRGPVVPVGGLTAANAGEWEKIWSITDYEPDQLLPFGTTGGALASYGDDLYWGTMNPPLIVGAFALLGHLQAQQSGQPGLNLDANGDGELGVDEILATLLGTHRAVSLFRARDASAADPRIELVYGERFLPRYDPQLRSYTIREDAFHENRLGLSPLQGASGFGNFFNGYTWTLEPFAGSLFIGTFDSSLVLRAGLWGVIAPLLGDALPAGFAQVERTIYEVGFPNEGADLLRIDGEDGRAFAESFRGVGNHTNYGVRTMLADEDGLFLGMANPMNLHEKGGWELLELQPMCVQPD